jgi:hypothetical protein
MLNILPIKKEEIRGKKTPLFQSYVIGNDGVIFPLRKMVDSTS